MAVVDGKKVCATCKENKDVSAYRKNGAAYGDGYRSYCMECDRARIRKYNKRYRERDGSQPKKAGSHAFMENGQLHKNCVRCGFTKLATEFGSNAAQRDGLNYYCRACVNITQTERRKRLSLNPGKVGRPKKEETPQPPPPSGEKFGCFLIKEDGTAECECGEQFIPSAIQLKFPRACWHLERQAKNKETARLSRRDTNNLIAGAWSGS